MYKYKTKIPVFGRRSSELQWLKKNWPEYQYLEGYDKNSNVWKDKIIIPMLTEKGPGFHHFEG